MSHFKTGLLALFIIALPNFSHAALSDYFVSTDWLAANRDKVVVLDVRNTAVYLLGHIDAALSVERSRFLQTRHHVKSLVPTVAAMRELLSSLGVDKATTLVVYAEDDNPYAARFVWTLRYHGHQQAYVLDGGYEKWKAEKRTTSLLPTLAPRPSHYEFASNSGVFDARADADYVYTRLESSGTLVWDTRSDGEYAGTDIRADRGGHIPGAVHLNWTELQKEVNGIKVLKSEKEIKALLATKGLTPDKEIVPHCQTGIRSSFATLVLLGLGYERVKNYDGSWIEWANDSYLPIVNAQGVVESSEPVSQSLATLDRTTSETSQVTR